MQSLEKNTLYIIATPLGNLGDISTRALETLSQVDWIAAEDTRHSQRLLQHFGINKPLISLHEHNEEARIAMLSEKLLAGGRGALISDAGTPLISDPGFVLVKALRKLEVGVVPIPGASAVISALSVAGLPTDSFTFLGFPPAKSSKRQSFFTPYKADKATLVFYESPHRLLESLQDMQKIFGADRPAFIAREMTKQFEQYLSGNLAELTNYFADNPDKVRGELVIILQGAETNETTPTSGAGIEDLIKILLAENLPVKQISQIVAQHYGIKKNEVYQQVLQLKNS